MKAKPTFPRIGCFKARLTLYGGEKLDDKDRLPCWDFTWLNDKDGHALEVVVFMDGKPMQLPTF